MDEQCDWMGLGGVCGNRKRVGCELEMWIEARVWKETKALGPHPSGNEEIMKIFN